MIHLTTFATDDMARAMRLCRDSAATHGVERSTGWSPESAAMLSMESAAFEHLLERPRGAGYWIWKPAIIRHDLQHLVDGDILIYSDAGVEFINNAHYIIDRMDQDIFLFGNNWEHAHWCKRDVIDAIWPAFDAGAAAEELFLDVPFGWYRFGKQCQASVIFFRVSDYSRRFVAEWLKWCLYRQRFSEGVCSDEWRYLIDDSPSILPNHPEFREHRHDQAILTTLAYREGIKLHYWPAQYNDGAFSYEKLPEYAGDDYPILFHHHRRRNHEWSEAA